MTGVAAGVRRAASAGALLLLAAACTSGGGSAEPASPSATGGGSGSPPATPAPTTTTMVAQRRALAAPAAVVTAGDESGLALAASQALFDLAPVAVLAPSGDPGAQQVAAPLAAAMGGPLLLAPPPPPPAPTPPPAPWAPVLAELARLQTRTVVAVGSAVDAARDALPDGIDVVATDGSGRAAKQHITGSGLGAAQPGVVALVNSQDPLAFAATATAESAGIAVVGMNGNDPRADPAAATALAGLAATQLVAIGAAGSAAPAASIAGLVATATAGTQLPGGGQLLFPGRRLVALYGHPGDETLGVLGEQSVEASVDRARRLAADYEGFGADVVIPTFEVITTVASSEAGPDGDYSLESKAEHIRPWVDAARDAGMYVLLDLQPGHTDFLTQAKMYEEFLAQPQVGLALDPEWRLGPDQRLLRDIGSVSADEVNATSAWLAELTRSHALPQKLFVLHEFRLSMVQNPELIVPRPELATVVQMDGQGNQSLKMSTWGAITTNAPPGALFGWKNFYDEDPQLRAPADVVALTPSPVLVTYQ